MAKVIPYYGEMKDGRLKLYEPDEFKEYLSQFEGKRVRLDVSLTKDARSDKQNRYWWGVVVQKFMQKFDHYEDKMECHYAILLACKEVLQREVRTLEGETVIFMRGSSELDTSEFTELISTVQRVGAKMGIDIPSPNEIPWWND